MQALEWFDLKGIRKSAARFDLKKLQNLSGQHINATDDAALLHEIHKFLSSNNKLVLSDEKTKLLTDAFYCLKNNVKTFSELIDKASFIFLDIPIPISPEASSFIDEYSIEMLKTLTPQLHNVTWSRGDLEQVCNDCAESFGVKFGKLASPLRAVLSGQTRTPSVFDMMLVLGRDETIARLENAEGY